MLDLLVWMQGRASPENGRRSLIRQIVFDGFDEATEKEANMEKTSSHLHRQLFREHGDDLGVGGIDFPGFQGALGGAVEESVC